VRLTHRDQERTDPLAESDCYDHTYREHVSGHVDVFPLESGEPEREIVIPDDVVTTGHVTTEQLKHQFEERLAARRRSTSRR
jgi:predicted amidophosphoribosyltransferase